MTIMLNSVSALGSWMTRSAQLFVFSYLFFFIFMYVMRVCRWRPVRFDDEATDAKHIGTLWAHKGRPGEIGRAPPCYNNPPLS